MKRIAGFITGLIVAIVLWFGFNHFSSDSFSNQNNEEMKQTITKSISSVKKVVTPIHNNKEEKIKNTDKHVAKQVTKSIIEEDIDPAVEYDTESDIDTDLIKTTQVVSEEPQVQKQYFWQPFDLQSKADGFAKYLSLESSVNCMAEKTGVGKFMIYFLYKNKQDRGEKISKIESTGINLKIANLIKE